ncbi:uncharacterized protein CEXT_344021 [Caerostris extrusa]|uniref:Uncharacterized protein n=1 Tax=Caerostris extrusa TaxID=172846 RepID=A0AAV4Y2M1_CAEEX|nr:uncharacterized protein CEXT_344021 [Caerostris extrusa]
MGQDQELSDKIHRSISIEARLFAVLLTFAVVIKGGLSCRFFHLRTSTTAHPSTLFQTTTPIFEEVHRTLWQDNVPWDTWPSVHNKDKIMAMAINPMAYQKEIAVNKVALYNINVYESGLRHQVSLGDIMGRQRFATGCLILGEFEEKIP